MILEKRQFAFTRGFLPYFVQSKESTSNGDRKNIRMRSLLFNRTTTFPIKVQSLPFQSSES